MTEAGLQIAGSERHPGHELQEHELKEFRVRKAPLREPFRIRQAARPNIGPVEFSSLRRKTTEDPARTPSPRNA
ncbi:MAG: hypothetical protein L3J96_08075 [Thermoplasmata archaeon]|nr:hypothetical protein [Thermoplasmata archaeon]